MKSLKKMKALTLVCLGVLMCLVLLLGRTALSPSPPPKTVAVTIGDIERSVRASGTLVPVLKVDVGSQVTGQVQKLLVELGQKVEKGEELAMIDPTLAQQDLRQQEALLAQQEAQLQAKLIDLRTAERERARQQSMTIGEATSKAEQETAQDLVLRLRAEVRGVSAMLRQSKSQIDTAKAKLAYTRILAPIAGTVISIQVQQGQTVNAVQQIPTVLTIAQLDRMTVRARVPEADITKIRSGQKVYFTTLGNEAVRHYGLVRTVQPAAEKIGTALFYNALFEVPNPKGELWPDMTVQAVFVLDARKNALLLPSSLFDSDTHKEATVLLFNKNGKAEKRSVTIGIDDGANTEITSGLRAGDRVLDAGSDAGA